MQICELNTINADFIKNNSNEKWKILTIIQT